MKTTAVLEHDNDLINRKIAEKLIVLFKKYVGRERSISKAFLYKELFNTTFYAGDPASFLRWEYVKRAMHFLRKRSNCFILSTSSAGNYYYYVPTTSKDVDEYDKNATNAINSIKLMQHRCRQSVAQKWYKQAWSIQKKQ